MSMILTYNMSASKIKRGMCICFFSSFKYVRSNRNHSKLHVFDRLNSRCCIKIFFILFSAPRRPNPLEIRYPLLAKLLLIFQLICGVSIGVLGIWILVWAPNTRLRDNPYWSGSAVMSLHWTTLFYTNLNEALYLQLVVSGILGLILINFRRVPRQKLREHCFSFIRVNSTMIALVAALLSLAAFVFAALHLDNITSSNTTCMPDNIFTSPNAACICLFGAKNSTNHLQIQTAEEGEITVGGFEFHYR